MKAHRSCLAVALAAVLGSGPGATAQTAPIAGRVVLAGWSEHVPEARVHLLTPRMHAVSTTRADADGHFSFRSVEPGQYYLQATYERRSSAVAGPVRVPDAEQTSVELTLPSELYTRARSCLWSDPLADRPDGQEGESAPEGSATGVLAGVAYDESTTTPLPAARIRIGWTDPEGVRRTREATTDAAGRFVFCDIAARVPLEVRLDVLGRLGSYHAGVRIRPNALARMDLSAALAGSTSLEILASTPGARTDSLAMLQGRLLDASTDAPIAGAVIALEGTQLRTVTDEEGGFRIAGVPAGEYAFQVTRLGYDWRSEYIDVQASSTMTLQLRAAPTAVALEAVVVRVSTPETRMAKAATQAPRVIAGEDLHRAEERAASLIDVIRRFPSLQIRTGQFETELGIERGVCIESSRALMRYAIPERKTPLPWCEMIAIVLDGAATIRGSEMINALRLRQVESIEFLPPTGALQYGERAALNGALVIWTRDRGPHRDPARWRPGS